MFKIDGYSHDLLKQINPQKIRLYLMSRGWIFDRKTKSSDVFQSPLDNSVVTVPNNRDFADYAERVDEVVRTISSVENISIQHIVAGMTMSCATDTLEFRYVPSNGEIGLIPVPELLKIVQTGYDLNNYAHRDETEFQNSYKTSNWKGKKDLDSIRVGPTLPGSYIVQFIYPTMTNSNILNVSLYNEIRPDNEVLFKMCNKVESSLRTVVEVAESGKTEIDSDFKISYNFVSSTLGLNFDNAEMEVKRLRTFERNSESKAPVYLTPELFKRVSIIETKMRPDEMLSEQDFIGKIIQLKQPRENLEDPGEVKIRYIDNFGDARSVTFSLIGDELSNAHEAFRDNRTISITGKLVGPNNSRRLEDTKCFKIL